MTPSGVMETTLPQHPSRMMDAYQMAASEIEHIQRLPWEELAPRQDGPWLSGADLLAGLPDAEGRLTIVDGFEGDAAVKQVIVALDFRHARQGRRTVRLVTLVRRPS